MNPLLWLSVRDRAKETIACVESLRETEGGRFDLWISDQGSEGDARTLYALYERWLADGIAQKVLISSRQSLENVFWDKNLALAEALALANAQEDRPEFFAMVDNDVVATGFWLDSCLAVLNDTDAVAAGIRVVSPYDGPPCYPTKVRKSFSGRQVAVRTRAVSRFWIARLSWWLSYKPPTSKRIVRHGRHDRQPTDNWYYEQMSERGEFFAFLEPNPVCNPQWKVESCRKTHKIGADCR